MFVYMHLFFMRIYLSLCYAVWTDSLCFLCLYLGKIMEVGSDAVS